MAIPLASTTITIERRTQQDEAQLVEADQDPWDSGYSDEPTATEWERIAEGVRAIISASNGLTVGPGDSEVVRWSLSCDPTDLGYLDRVVDEYDGTTYSVEWSITTPGIIGMLSSTRAGLKTREGA